MGLLMLQFEIVMDWMRVFISGGYPLELAGLAGGRCRPEGPVGLKSFLSLCQVAINILFTFVRMPNRATFANPAKIPDDGCLRCVPLNSALRSVA